ncbi:Topless-related protein 3 [Hibiscus syriacus]|uniref:Topless-related protein 3 n=1 Tax=Hibiscus syriacus TaxID=106335 RepID=A0A6A3CYB7_HIBSY|nr:Topless-related protein 3 [Hibiscus syriacus]
MSSLSRELVFLILQFLEEEKFKESVHRLEKESGFFFNMKFFEEKVQAGEWDEVEKYLSGFTKVDDNRYSMNIFFEIRKQKYLEAFDRQDEAKAVEILVGDLKLAFPTLKSSRLRTLINQSLNWQHQLCKNPRSNPDIKTLFTDHTCMPASSPLAPTPANLPVASVAKPPAYTSLGVCLFPPTPAAATNAGALACWMASASASSSVQAAVVTALYMPVPQNQVSVLKHSRTTPSVSGMVDYQKPDHEQLMKRLRSASSVEEGSVVTSMDFHPSHHTLLLGHNVIGAVGSTNGEITLWEIGMQEKMVSKSFKIWEMSTCSIPFQALMVNLYLSATSHGVLMEVLWIDAHAGGVNDLAFAHPNKQLCIVTCGDDKIIKVWDSVTGKKLFNFKGHDAPVYSIYPHHKENIQFIFSNAVDGKIKAWLYDNLGSRVDYDPPGHWCTTMLYSADGSRLFSCGTSKDGESFLVEWNESEGAIKRTYVGFRKKSAGVVSFDTTQNHFLAAGEDSQIKFWDMDNINLLTFTDAEGGLPASGSSALANVSSASGKVERNSPVGPSSVLHGVGPLVRSVEKSRVLDDAVDKTKPWQLVEIVDPAQCRLVTLPDSTDSSSKVVRLLYTNNANGILVLGSNGVQKLWKWLHNEQNPSVKATANVVPHHWQPNSGLMTNDVIGVNLEEAVPCIAVSKNDSYVLSATGGKVSLFNLMTFRVMTTFMSPPPASTFLAFHPQDNNIIAIGMEDSTIHIYNVRVAEVKSKLKGHQKRITGLAFSTSLNILVSSGADAHLCCGALILHVTQLAIYDASKMVRIQQWIPQDVLSAPIKYAAYSCNSQFVYAAFYDGNIGVFDADSMRLRCHIASSVYLSPALLKGKQAVSPLVVTAHPMDANQFAIGLSDGTVKPMEPSESEGKWGVNPPPMDNSVVNGRTTSSSTTSN